MQVYSEEDQVCLFNPDLWSGKTSPEPSPAAVRREKISGSSSKKSWELSFIPYQYLDLTPGAGNLLGVFFWEILSPWHGGCWMRNTGASPSVAAESTLSQILEERPHPKYYLTRKACLGIIRRASERGKPLPPQLLAALEIQAGLRTEAHPIPMTAFAANQRDEVRDLHNVAGALGAQPGMKQQTFIAEEQPLLCLNDQGGSFMNTTMNITGTLRAQMHSHQPLLLESNQNHATIRDDGVSTTLPASMGMGGGYVPMVYENHGVDGRYKGPLEVAPTIMARCGTGGNNVPLVGSGESVFCIMGNAIDREPHNGGNGIGYQTDVGYTLTATDRHAVFSRQRVDVFQENDVVSTESARQHKDATDLVLQTYQQTVGTIGYTDHKGIDNQYVGEDKCIVEGINLIRRLTPLECERLQGFPDGWTNIPTASDSARYKALGNSVAIPCVEYVMQGIALVLLAERRRRVLKQVILQRAA